MTPEVALESLYPDHFDVLATIGSPGWEAAEAPDLGVVIRSALSLGRPVGAICCGTLSAARPGVLAEWCHTSNAADYLRDHVPTYDWALRYVNSPR